MESWVFSFRCNTYSQKLKLAAVENSQTKRTKKAIESGRVMFKGIASTVKAHIVNKVNYIEKKKQEFK